MIRRILNRIVGSPTMMNWISQLTGFIHGLFITSLILIKFSTIDYSFWMLLKTLSAFGILAEAGLGRTIERSVSFFFSGASRLPKNKADFNSLNEESSTPNLPQLAQLLYTTKYIYLILSSVTIVLLASAGTAFLWNLFTQSGHSQNLWAAYFLMIFQSLILLQSIKWKSFMTGTRHLVQLYRLNTIISLVRIFGFLAILLSGRGIEYLMAYIVIEQLLAYFYMRSFMVRWFKSNDFILTRSLKLNKEIFSSLWSVSWKSGLNTWGFFFSNRGVDLIISQLKDTTLMAGFLFTTAILRFIRKVAQTAVTVKYPEVYGLMSLKRYDVLKKVMSPRIFLSICIMVIGFISFGLSGNWLLDMIGVEDKRLVPLSIFVMMSIYLVLESHALIHGTIYISTNDVPFLIPGLITGALTFFLGSLVLSRWGLPGLVLLQLVLNLANNFWYSAYLSLKLLSWPLVTYLKNVFINGPRYWISRIAALKL